MDSKTKQQKHSLKPSKSVSKYTRDTVDFIFNDESRISVELSFLKKYPTSLLSLTLENSANYLQGEDAYYIDSSRYSVDSLILYMEGNISLESLSMNEVCEIRDAADYFFGNDIIDIKDKIEAVLQSFLNIFMKQNDCSIYYEPYNEDLSYKEGHIAQQLYIQGEITKERNEKFQEYSRLFDVFNIKRVQVEFEFYVDIPYEYIYPSNLHELFPKIEEYTIEISVIELNKEICIPPSDPRYIILYKEYKRQYYKKYYPEAYDEYISTQPDIYAFSLPDNTITLHSSINNENHYQEEEENIHHEIIPIDIDEEIKNENDNEKPDLYINSFYEYIPRNHKQEVINKNNETIISKKNDYVTYKFSFLEENGQLNISNPTISYSKYIYDYYSGSEYAYRCYQIDNYLLKLPISKQLRNFRNFINCSMYPEYIQLFIEIIRTHVFPNVKTLQINEITRDNPNILLYQEIVTLITRDHFPTLSIYTINNKEFYSYYQNSISIISSLIPVSLIKLVDTICIYNQGNDIILLNQSFVNTMCQIKQYHEFKIQFDFAIHEYNELWKQLFDSEIINFNILEISISERYQYIHDYSFDLSHCFIKCLNIDIEKDLIDKIYEIQNLLQTINTTNLIEIHFTCDKYKNYPNDTEIYPFEMFNNISDFINTKKLIHLQSISLDCPLRYPDINRDPYECVYPFIVAITNCSSDSLPSLEQFDVIDDYSDNNESLFTIFPSFCFYSHKPCYYIKMNCRILFNYDLFLDYSEYIYNELQKPYTKGITNLYLCIYKYYFQYGSTDKIDIDDYMPLLNNYIEETNNNLDISSRSFGEIHSDGEEYY
ncbi:hypothetical protein WA158_004702 [Blastocystis sp. Blastoise]